MKKYSKFILLNIIFIIAFNSFPTYKISKAETSPTHLTIDSFNKPILPRNFRKSSDKINNPPASLNLNGLNTLNISGSSQFSEEPLKLVREAIGRNIPITVIDLRQESHGFINGMAVSWSNDKNNGNMGLTKEQVIVDENNKLNSIPLNKPITFYNHPNEVIVPTIVENENKLVASQSMNYIRIPVTDGKLPTNDMVDYFIDSINLLPKNIWLHFHCKAGIGRTTTFMVMYDMMKNYNKVSAEDIIKRQVLLAGFSPKTSASFYSKERIDFLNKFYKYCKESNNFKVKWSQWNKDNQGITINFNEDYKVS